MLFVRCLVGLFAIELISWRRTVESCIDGPAHPEPTLARLLPDLTERVLDTGDRAQDEGDDHGVEGVALELAKVLAESLA